MRSITAAMFLLLVVVLLAACTKPAQPAVKAVYQCAPDIALAVEYDNSSGGDGVARLSLEGREYVLDHVRSGSGARYETQQGRAPGSTLVWWNKGADGTLLEGVAGNPSAEETMIASCSPAPR